MKRIAISMVAAVAVSGVGFFWFYGSEDANGSTADSMESVEFDEYESSAVTANEESATAEGPNRADASARTPGETETPEEKRTERESGPRTASTEVEVLSIERRDEPEPPRRRRSARNGERPRSNSGGEFQRLPEEMIRQQQLQNIKSLPQNLERLRTPPMFESSDLPITSDEVTSNGD